MRVCIFILYLSTVFPFLSQTSLSDAGELSYLNKETNENENYQEATNRRNSKFWLPILSEKDIEVAVLNYENLENVLKYEKLEIGVTLPQAILTKVNNFVKNEAVANSEKLNPYMDWELRVFAEFTSGDSEFPIVIDGFYSQEFVVKMPKRLPIPRKGGMYSDEEYAAIGGWTETANNFPFRVRFAPNQIGLWSGKVFIEINGERIYASSPFKFNVIESGNVGYVQVGVNKRYLRREGTFFPVGCNLKWPETTPASDPELWDFLIEEYKMAESYRHVYAMPRVYDKFREMMSLLSKNGGNYFRWIMFPTSTEMEWEELGNYTMRLHMAQEMDDIVDYAKELDLFIHWNMQIHYSLQFSANAYSNKWTWDYHTNGADYCYKVLVNSNNPMDFFTDVEAKRYYKQRLRYILARWGYSTNIAVWELFSEISNVGAPQADNNEYYMQGDNWKIYRDWQLEMAEYLKSMYHGQCHLVTASFGGEKHPDDDTFESPHMDIMTSNIYDYEQPDFGLFSVNKVAGSVLNDKNNSSYTFTVTKPLIFSEMDPIDALCDKNRTEVIRNIWQCTFSGLAGALSWDMQMTPELFGIYSQVRSFVDGIDFDGEGWHPGSVDQEITYDMDYSSFPPTIKGVKNNVWTFNEEYAKFMDGLVDRPENGGKRVKKADLAYLRSGDKNFAIGIVTNKTLNIKSITDCYPGPWPMTDLNASPTVYGYEPLSTFQNLDTKHEDLIICDLNQSASKFSIAYYNKDLSREFVFSQRKFRNNSINIKIDLQKYYPEEYLIPIKITRKNLIFPE